MLRCGSALAALETLMDEFPEVVDPARLTDVVLSTLSDYKTQQEDKFPGTVVPLDTQCLATGQRLLAKVANINGGAALVARNKDLIKIMTAHMRKKAPKSEPPAEHQKVLQAKQTMLQSVVMLDNLSAISGSSDWQTFIGKYVERDASLKSHFDLLKSEAQ